MAISSLNRWIFLFVVCAGVCGSCRGQEREVPRFKAIAFDYFVLFDQSSVVRAVEKNFQGRGAEFAKAWREKQYEYTFLRTITDRHVDYFRIAEDSLVYTAKAARLDLTPESRKALLNAYLTLKPWPDTVDALRRLKASGIRLITLSNLSPKMVRTNAEAAGIAELFDELLSTEVNGTFKPDPRAYALGMERLNLKKEEIVFAASAGWDAYGAKAFGYTTYWVNRSNLPVEELGIEADETSNGMEGLVKFVMRKS
jgi:2-haloacid dehalogenase